jgi:hypothetical protein
MKAIIGCILFLVSSQLSFADASAAARRSNGLLRFIVEQEGLRNLALRSVINNRCNRYMSAGGRKPCREAVKRMMDVLDYDIIVPADKNLIRDRDSWTPSSFVFVAFKTNLIQLLSEARTAAYLRDLNEQLYQYLAGGLTRPNVWNITLKHYKTDYATAMALATLFQDTSPMKLHLVYLAKTGTRGNGSFHSNMELLDRVIGTINLILDISEDNYRSLFYPEEIQKDLNRNIYHFYVPLFLAKNLKLRGYSEYQSRTAALMLTLTYEFITSAPDYRYLYQDPPYIESLHKVKDIFGGYCGANIGVRGMNFYKSFPVIHHYFLRSTEEGVNLLISY